MVAILFVSACSKKADKQADPSATPPAGETNPAGSTGAPEEGGSATGSDDVGEADEAVGDSIEGAPPGAVLDCEKLVPKALRDKYAAGATVERRYFECLLKPAGKDSVMGTVAAVCDDGVKLLKDGVIKNLKTNAGAHDVAGVGQAAVEHTTDATGQNHIVAWDNDSNCQLTLMVDKGIDAAAFAKDLLAGLPVK